MCVFLVQKMKTLIFSLSGNTFSNRSFDKKQEIVEKGKPKLAMKNLANICTYKTGARESFLALKFHSFVPSLSFYSRDL